MVGAQTLAMVAFPLCTLLLALRFAVPASSRRRRIRSKVLLRALFPRRILRTRSGQADVVYFLLNKLALGSLLGWALLSIAFIARWARPELDTLFGPRQALDLSPFMASAALTVATFLAIDFAYWLNHWMSHRFAFLWAFHKVHHTAESLSLLTGYRVHPVDSIIFYNTTALIVGLTAAIVTYLLGRDVDVWALGGTNALLFLSTWLLINLQHSHLWITFPGRVGRWFLSPAHHQIHHSVDPRHHNRNLGSVLSLWDRLFGTHFPPTRTREKLVFGIEDNPFDPHSLKGATVMPFVEAGQLVSGRVSQPAAAEGLAA